MIEIGRKTLLPKIPWHLSITDFIHTEGQQEMPCPAATLSEAKDIVAWYDTQFVHQKMMLQIRGIKLSTETRYFTETMAVVKPDGRDGIKLWFIITTWRIHKHPPQGFYNNLYTYEVVPFVAVIYVEGNQQARANWRRGQHQELLRLGELMENLGIDENLRQAIRGNLADPQPA